MRFATEPAMQVAHESATEKALNRLRRTGEKIIARGATIAKPFVYTDRRYAADSARILQAGDSDWKYTVVKNANGEGFCIRVEENDGTYIGIF